ncbi:hypothetical protein AB751O23_BC_00020 [Chlamydiales bacterium SCGC AB-751-O23]|jgi:hypothetical protein|nr:hypothetical protein AB751O23_BC_00020 [Chlamydiales bacterium SCGC AB-751-O23]
MTSPVSKSNHSIEHNLVRKMFLTKEVRDIRAGNLSCCIISAEKAHLLIVSTVPFATPVSNSYDRFAQVLPSSFSQLTLKVEPGFISAFKNLAFEVDNNIYFSGYRIEVLDTEPFVEFDLPSKFSHNLLLSPDGSYTNRGLRITRVSNTWVPAPSYPNWRGVSFEAPGIRAWVHEGNPKSIGNARGLKDRKEKALGDAVDKMRLELASPSISESLKKRYEAEIKEMEQIRQDSIASQVQPGDVNSFGSTTIQYSIQKKMSEGVNLDLAVASLYDKYMGLIFFNLTRPISMLKLGEAVCILAPKDFNSMHSLFQAGMGQLNRNLRMLLADESEYDPSELAYWKDSYPSEKNSCLKTFEEYSLLKTDHPHEELVLKWARKCFRNLRILLNWISRSNNEVFLKKTPEERSKAIDFYEKLLKSLKNLIKSTSIPCEIRFEYEGLDRSILQLQDIRKKGMKLEKANLKKKELKELRIGKTDSGREEIKKAKQKVVTIGSTMKSIHCFKRLTEDGIFVFGFSKDKESDPLNTLNSVHLKTQTLDTWEDLSRRILKLNLNYVPGLKLLTYNPLN